MSYRELKPDTGLQNLIHSYGFLDFQQELKIPLKEKISPLPGYSWLFTQYKASPLIIHNGNELAPLSNFIELGLHSKQVTITHRGLFKIFVVRFSPGFSPFEEQRLALHMEAEKLNHYFKHSSTSLEDMVGYVNSFFSTHPRLLKEPDAITIEALKQIHKNPASPVSTLSKNLFFCARHLRRVFTLNTGMPLKAYQQIVRFSHCMQTLESQTSPQILKIACNCGFSDQTHFSKECKSLTGLTPKQFLSGKYPLTTGLLWRNNA